MTLKHTHTTSCTSRFVCVCTNLLLKSILIVVDSETQNCNWTINSVSGILCFNLKNIAVCQNVFFVKSALYPLVSQFEISNRKADKCHSIFFICLSFSEVYLNLFIPILWLLKKCFILLINREKRKYEISYVCGPGSTPLLGLTIGQLLQSTADKYGDREAVVVVHQKIRKTYQQLLTDVSIES